MTPSEFRHAAGTVAAFAILGLGLVLRGAGAPTWAIIPACFATAAVLAVVIVNASRTL